MIALLVLLMALTQGHVTEHWCAPTVRVDCRVYIHNPGRPDYPANAWRTERPNGNTDVTFTAQAGAADKVWEYAGAYHWLMRFRGESIPACDVAAFRRRHPDLDGQKWGVDSECFAASVVESGRLTIVRSDDEVVVIDDDAPASFVANDDDAPVDELEPGAA